MVQNRNKLIELFIGNISNAIVHNILEKAIEIEEISNKYKRELKTSFDIAKHYRSMINPVNKSLPLKDIDFIKNKIINNVKNELTLRISKGYRNIDLSLVEETVNNFLKELIVIE